jgi:ankyrin repeat protein
VLPLCPTRMFDTFREWGLDTCDFWIRGPCRISERLSIVFLPTEVLCLIWESRRGGKGMRLNTSCRCTGSGAMEGILEAVRDGDLTEVERLIGQDPGQLETRGAVGWTPLMWASAEGHVGVARWLVDKGAAINVHDYDGRTVKAAPFGDAAAGEGGRPHHRHG